MPIVCTLRALHICIRSHLHPSRSIHQSRRGQLPGDPGDLRLVRRLLAGHVRGASGGGDAARGRGDGGERQRHPQARRERLPGRRLGRDAVQEERQGGQAQQHPTPAHGELDHYHLLPQV